jgi:hypothetical protein
MTMNGGATTWSRRGKQSDQDGLTTGSKTGKAPVFIVELLHNCLRAIGTVYELKKKKKKKK